MKNRKREKKTYTEITHDEKYKHVIATIENMCAQLNDER